MNPLHRRVNLWQCIAAVNEEATMYQRPFELGKDRTQPCAFASSWLLDAIR